jgi:hypothetical protein
MDFIKDLRGASSATSVVTADRVGFEFPGAGVAVPPGFLYFENMDVPFP